MATDALTPPPPAGFTLDAEPVPPAGFTLDAPPPLRAKADVQGMFAGLGKVTAALPPDEQVRATDYLDTVPEDQKPAETAALANAHFLEEAYGGKMDAATIYANRAAVQHDYATQMGWNADGKPMDDVAFYSRVQQHFKQRKDEAALLNESMGAMFKAFETGDPNGRTAFTSVLAQMRGKPGYDPTRLDIYRTLAAKQWQSWQEMGQHYPGVVDALANYVKTVREGSALNESTADTLNRSDRWDVMKKAAIDGLQSVAPEDQAAILSLANQRLSGAGMKSPSETGDAKLGNRVMDSTLDFLDHALSGGKSLLSAQAPGGAAISATEAIATAPQRKAQRQLDQLMHGASDPDRGNNWLSEASLSTAAALPQMLAMMHPAGIALNFAAVSDSAAGHLEDVGVAPDKAQLLGAVAAVPLTALQAASTKLIFGKALTGKFAGWSAGNIQGMMGKELVAGYAKNVAATAAVETAGFGLITAGQQMTEPAVQSVASLMDHTIPGVKWTGKDGEFAHMAGATPETLASMVPMILLGTGAGMLRHEAFARTVHNEMILAAVGVPNDVIKDMQVLPPDQAAEVLQSRWEQREQGTQEQAAAVAKLNAETNGPEAATTPLAAKLADDGTYRVSDAAGNVVDQTSSPEMAAHAMEAPDLSTPEGQIVADRPAAMRFGITNPAMARAMNWIAGVGYTARNLWQELRSIPKFSQFKEIINRFNGEGQVRGMELAASVKKIFAAVPDKLTREAMFASIEAGHDPKILADWAARENKSYAKRVYEAAANLTTEQVDYAKKLGAWFEAQHPKAVQAGLLDPAQKRANYVPLMVDKEYDGSVARANPKFKGNFSHAIARDFENSFELENSTDNKGQNLGLRVKTRDIAEVLAAYGSELDRVDLTRQALKALESAKAKAEDGEPLVQGINPVLHLGETPDKGSTISNPSTKTTEAGVKYETLDHPAFKKWYFAGNDAEGNPVMSRGEMGLHPEIYQHMANVLGRSQLKMWQESPGSAVAGLAKVSMKGVEEAQKFVKANMFSASAFHATHIGTRAAGNLVAPWELSRVDAKNPEIQNMMRLGLQLHGDNAAMQAVSEGLGGGQGYNVLAKVPGIGKVVDAITHTTFHEIIPAYKAAIWEKLNERNLKIFAKEISAGRVTQDQVGYLTSKQVNARFGELNYNDIGRNPTFQHILSLTTLAPDFWTANMQNFSQVATGLTGAKAGREPMKAFVITAAVSWLSSRILNKALSDDNEWHNEEPFALVRGGRTYSFRTEVQDIAKMVTTPGQYLMGRLSPFASSVLEYISGVNWRGEKVNFTDVLKETAGKAIPASIKWLPGPSAADEWATGRRATTTHFEQFLTSQGIKVGRDSPLTPAYKLAHEYKVAQGDDDKGGSYPVSKFQQLRYALEDGDMAKAQAERTKLIEVEHGNPAKVNQGFHSSLHHAWTGSAAADAKFKASLSPEDRAKVEKAQAHRDAIWTRYGQLLSPPDASMGH